MLHLQLFRNLRRHYLFYHRAFKPNRGTGDQGQSSLFTGERRLKNDQLFHSVGQIDELTSYLGFLISCLIWRMVWKQLCKLNGNTMLNRTLENKLNMVRDAAYKRTWKSDAFSTGCTGFVLLKPCGLLCRARILKLGLFELADEFHGVQCCLQDLNSSIATPITSATTAQLGRVQFDASIVDEINNRVDKYAHHLPPLRQFILPNRIPQMKGGSETSSHVHVARTICRRAERNLVSLLDNDAVDPNCVRFVNRLSDFLFIAARYVAQCEGVEEVTYRKPKLKKPIS